MRMKLAVAALLATMVAGASSAYAQANAANYTYTTGTTASFTDMSSGTTTLVAADADDTVSAVTVLPFDFFLMGARQDRFTLSANGTLRFGATAVSGTLYNPLGQAGQSLITPYGADQRTHAGNGKIHFKTIGSEPNRTVVIEFLNMQANFNSGGTADLTYQMRISESTGAIEFVYGPMAMSANGAADANSNSPQFGFSSNNTAGTVGSITAAQSGTPAPTYDGTLALPVDNLYVAGPIAVLDSAVDGARRNFLMTPPVVAPPGGPLSFTSVGPTGMTLNWTDSANEVGYAIYNSTDGGVTFAFVGTAAQNAVSFPATGLLAGTPYTWRVYAFTEGSKDFIAGAQGTSPATPNTSLATGAWSNPATWSDGAVPDVGDNVTIAAGHVVTIDTAAVAYSVTVAGTGILQYETATARTLAVTTDLTVQSGGTLQSGVSGTVTTHTLSLGGNLVNDGTLDFSTNGDTAGAGITFTGATNAAFSGAGATTDIRTLTVNKGVTAAPILELLPTNFTVRGVTTDTVVGGWLTLTNGTLKLSGTFTATSRVFGTTGYTIGATTGFWLNNPNYTVAGQNGSPTNNGTLRITQGTFNVGTATGNSISGGAGSLFRIEGGTMNVTGRLSSTTSATYNQSGGTVNLATISYTSTTGTFSFSSTAGTFIMSGGTMNLVQANTNATPVDFRNDSNVNTITGGVLNIGTAATATNFNFRIRGNIPNVVIDNTTNNKTATSTAQTNLRGTTTITPGATMVINGQVCLVIGPTFTNNGTLTGTTANTRFYFLGIAGPSTYTGTGVVTAPLTQFEVDNTAGVTIDPGTTNQIIAARFNNFSGGLTGAGKLTLGNGGTTAAVVQLGVTGATSAVLGFDVAPVFNPGTGGEIIIYAQEIGPRTTGVEVQPSRTLAALIVQNLNPITIAGGDITVNGTTATALSLTAGRIVTGSNTLYFNPGVGGAVTRVAGHVDGNFKKAFAAAGSQTFEVGTANGYSPVIVNATAGTFPADITVKAVQTAAPGFPIALAIARYWNVAAPGVTADLTFTYIDPTDLGATTEANLHLYREDGGTPSGWSDLAGVVTPGSDTAAATGLVTFGNFTLGEVGGDLAITKTDGVGSVSAGGTTTYTITATNAGPNAVVGANVSDPFPATLACSTTCVASVGSTCPAGPSVTSINDSVDILAGGNVTYTSVCNVSGAATGSILNTATIAAPGGFGDGISSNNTAADADIVTGNNLFVDGFETGDTSRWGISSSLTFAQVTVLRVSSSTLAFDYDLSAFPAGRAIGPTAIATLRDEANRPLFMVVVRRAEASSPLELRLVAADRGTNWTEVGERRQQIEIESTSVDGKVNVLGLKLDGRLALSLGGFRPTAAPASVRVLSGPQSQE